MKWHPVLLVLNEYIAFRNNMTAGVINRRSSTNTYKMNTKSLPIVLFIFLLLFNACTSKEEVLEQPNIVWIVSEDNSKHYLKLFDENGVATPNIESLARQGVTFTRAFSNAPVCSAARSTLISGCYGPRMASHYHRRSQKVPMPEGIEMYPAYLKKAGYYTTK